MARTTLSSTVLSTSGVSMWAGADAAGDVGNGNEFDNDGDVMLTVRNADGAASHNVTFGIPTLIDGQAVPDFTVNIPLSTQRVFGPFRTALYNQPNGRVNVNVDSAQLFLKCVRIPDNS